MEKINLDNADIVLKDEGDFITVMFQTDKAKDSLKNQSYEVKEQLYGDLNGIRKLDIDISSKNLIISFAISHGLTVIDF